MNIYLSKDEQVRLKALAEDLGVTHAYIVRLAFRALIGLPLGESGEHAREHIVKSVPTGHVQNLTGAR